MISPRGNPPIPSAVAVAGSCDLIHLPSVRAHQVSHYEFKLGGEPHSAEPRREHCNRDGSPRRCFGVVIPRADAATLWGIATMRRDLAERAPAGRLRPADIAGATFTISNLGMYRIDSFSAIITPPQTAVLDVGSITDRVVSVEGQAVVPPAMTATLSSDHRVVDGARAADFLNALAEAVKIPPLVANFVTLCR